jgi:hypothetical protein
MAGDPTNAPVWAEADVLLGDEGATIPTHPAAYDTGEWDFVGLLDDNNPFDAGAETIDKTDHSAFGYGVYATTYKNQKEVVTFTALETTLITLGLLYDVTDVTTGGGVISGTLKRRDPTRRFAIAFETRSGTKMERRTAKNYAYIDDISRNMADGKKTYTVTSVIVPTSDNELFDYYEGPQEDES